MKKQQKKKIHKLKYLDYSCQIGERVYWENIVGQRSEGVIIEWKSNVAIIKTDDGTEKPVLC
jgi:hypothetical protein